MKKTALLEFQSPIKALEQKKIFIKLTFKIKKITKNFKFTKLVDGLNRIL